MSTTKPDSRRRLPQAERRRQLLNAARQIVREEGADRLTLGYLAIQAGVSKPVVYDHFGTRSGLLIELYRWIDTEKVKAFRDAMAQGSRTVEETVNMLASAYISCVTDEHGEFHAVGAALAGSEEKAAVLDELLAASVQMFISVLQPYACLPAAELERCCIGLVGAGEALAAATVRGNCTQREAIESFASIVRCQFAAG